MQQNLFGKEAKEIEPKKKPEKVEIVITPNCGPFSESVDKHGGKYYTSVGFMSNSYGSGSPCVGDEEIKKSIIRARERILDHGDIPVVKDLRALTKLEGG